MRGVDPKDYVSLRLLAEDHQSWASVQLRSDELVELRGLAPGSYRAVAQAGVGGSTFELGEVALALRAGEVSRAVLDLAKAPDLELAVASGAVHIPCAWSAQAAKLALVFLDTVLEGRESHQVLEATKVPVEREGFDTFRWARGELQVGRYELELHDPSFLTAFELPRGGRNDVEITLPPPAELAVHVVDDSTGAPAPTETLIWRPIWAEGVRDGGVDMAPPIAPGEYRIRAPRAELVMNVTGWMYQPRSFRVDLARGATELTMPLKRSSGFQIELRDGETPVAFPGGWDPKPVHHGGIGHASGTNFEPFERKVMVTQPGTYTLELPSISGYQPIAPLTFDVAADAFTELVVELARKH